jgi:hypothetical protein
MHGLLCDPGSYLCLSYDYFELLHFNQLAGWPQGINLSSASTFSERSIAGTVMTSNLSRPTTPTLIKLAP